LNIGILTLTLTFTQHLAVNVSLSCMKTGMKIKKPGHL